MIKHTKKLSLALVFVMGIMTFAGCGTQPTTNQSAGAASTSGKVYKIGICQQLEHEALDAATEGFQAALTEALGEGNVEFDLQNAQNEAANCSTIVSGFVSNDVDLIMANATSALQAAAAATSDIPIVGTSVTDYATALDLSDWTGATGRNITGTSDLAPLDKQAEMIKELVPDVKTVGLLYCSAEPNSSYQVQEISKKLDEMGIAYKEYSAADSNEIQSVATKAVADCDALYIPTDNTMASNTEIVNNVAEPAKVPVIAGEKGICSGCGVATLSIDYYDIGYAAGQMAYEILTKGTDPGTIKIGTAANVQKLYDADRCKTLGITVPSDYSEITEE